RRGWLKMGVPESATETISVHMYQMAACCGRRDTVRQHQPRYSVPLTVSSPFTSIRGQTGMETKRVREELGLDYLTLSVPPKSPGTMRLHTAFAVSNEEGISPVTQVVHQVDKFQALSQAYIYSCRYPDLALIERTSRTSEWFAERADAILCAWEAADLRIKISLSIVVGGPGVGKGTQYELAAREFGLKHVSVGDLLRGKRSLPGSVYRDFISKSFRNGVPVPPTLVMRLFNVELQGLRADGSNTCGMILDGFPLAKDQLPRLRKDEPMSPIPKSNPSNTTPRCHLDVQPFS
ncbi:hypothetical protein C8A00DRAFT_18005, partial [Chaetomidium leptoderma]